MRHAVTGLKLVFCLALLSAGPAFTQSPSEEEISKSTVAPAPVAHVYVQTTKGVDVYDATAAGKLTLVKGSPFATSGQMEGINGKYLISVGTDYLHTYSIESNGAVGKQASEINTQNYGGSECGTTSAFASAGYPGYPNGALLDHTGQDFYVQLFGASDDGGEDTNCAAWQSYRVQSNGTFTFLGSIDYAGQAGHDASQSSVPTVSGNDKFAYGIFGQGSSGIYFTTFSTFTRTAAGDLNVSDNFTEKDPATDPNLPNSPWYYFPASAKADPANHLAVLLASQSFQGPGYDGPYQLASYTINVTGGVSSTNTWENMPTPAVTSIGVMDMSPSGKLWPWQGTRACKSSTSTERLRSRLTAR
jgi:hypothetical protein